MADNHSFWAYYRRFASTFAIEVLHTARAEVGSTVALALIVYVSTHRVDTSAWAALRLTLKSSLWLVGFWGIWHLVRTPWKLSLQVDNSEPSIDVEADRLSTEILDFIYERMRSEPAMPSMMESYLPIGQDSKEWWDAHKERQHKIELVKTYEQDTRGMFEYKFRKRTLRTLSCLRKLHIFSDPLEEYLAPFAAWLFPYSTVIKYIGESVGRLGERASQTLNNHQ